MLIKLAELGDIDEIMVLIDRVNKYLMSIGFTNWNKGYPNRELIEKDVMNREQNILVINNVITGIYSSAKYDYEVFPELNFRDKYNNFAMVHRLAVLPTEQGKGYAKLMMSHAEDKYKRDSFTSIRLGVHSSNAKLVKFYLDLDYEVRGEAYFEVDEAPFFIMEKIIS